MQSFKTFGSFKIKSRTLEFNIIFSFFKSVGTYTHDLVMAIAMLYQI